MEDCADWFFLGLESSECTTFLKSDRLLVVLLAGGTGSCCRVALTEPVGTRRERTTEEVVGGICMAIEVNVSLGNPHKTGAES